MEEDMSTDPKEAEQALTEQVIASFAKTPDDRLRTLMQSLVRHMHAFVREVEPTEAEWMSAIRFLTDTGKMCDDLVRQEFILLSDTLGLSALVNGLHDKTAIEEGTHTSLLGPFYRETTPKLSPGSQIAKKVKPGSECALYGRITDVAGKPLAGATVSVWQTGADGLYDIQEAGAAVDYRGVFATDADGRYYLRTVKPIGYSIPMDGPIGALFRHTEISEMRPAHIHFCIEAPGYRRIVTHLFDRACKYIETDVVYGVKAPLIVDFVEHPPGVAPNGETVETKFYTVRYDFVLQAVAEVAAAAE
jgi:hydroxyquinol 1,2-dioxygenase